MLTGMGWGIPGEKKKNHDEFNRFHHGSFSFIYYTPNTYPFSRLLPFDGASILG
jgi:hypothetical protein